MVRSASIARFSSCEKLCHCARTVSEEDSTDNETAVKTEQKPTVQPLIQKKTVPMRTLNVHIKTIKTEADIDELTAEINRKLKEQLQENTEITVQF